MKPKRPPESAHGWAWPFQCERPHYFTPEHESLCEEFRCKPEAPRTRSTVAFEKDCPVCAKMLARFLAGLALRP